MNRGAVICFCLSLLLVSCETLIFDQEATDNPRENFDYLWRQCNEKYSFFEYKKIDWQAMNAKYAAQIKDKMTSDELFKVLFSMLNELQDGHVNLISPFRQSRFDFDLLGPENIDLRVVRENYLKNDYIITGPFQHNVVGADKKIAYVRYNSFEDRVAPAHVAYILSYYRNTQGLILDIRQNGGGSAANIFKILNQLVSEKTLLYNSFLKSGPGKDDFAGPQPAYAEPDENRFKYGKKIAVLIDRGTFSAASFFALGAREVDNMIVIGDKSGGGLGLPNGGQMPNGWTYRFSISQTLSPAGENFENGVPPDIQVILTKSDRDRGVDTVIERAIQELK
ncbi:MAG: S41 family peptidase [Haliscomenobacter sp.]|nr:S41 family peptidase [Haliscomenobacter sp.]MBK9488702.1 S41 family peptidase [Haliscomenobacter sp.]